MQHFVYLTGYEGETIGSFLKKITRSEARAIIDVREIPLSRKNGFGKLHLGKALENIGVKYYHLPQLGSPSKLRAALRATGDYLSFFKEYRKYIQGKARELSILLDIIDEEKRSCLLCFEKHSDLCHRSILASEILKRTPHLTVTPL